MKKLIFIDDSPLDHFILKRILFKYNLAYEISCTENGEEVIRFLEQNRLSKNVLPDIILLDLYMPQFDGWAFLETIDRKNVKVMVTTIHTVPKRIYKTYTQRFDARNNA